MNIFVSKNGYEHVKTSLVNDKVSQEIELHRSNVSVYVDGCYTGRIHRKRLYDMEHIIPLTTVGCIKKTLSFNEKSQGNSKELKDMTIVNSKKMIIKNISLSRCVKTHYASKNKFLSNDRIDSACTGIIITLTKKNTQEFPIIYYDLITNIRIKAKILSKTMPSTLEYDPTLIKISELNKKKYGIDIRDGAYYIPLSDKSTGIDLCRSNANLLITFETEDKPGNNPLGYFVDPNEEYLISVYCVFNSSITLKNGMYMP